MHGKDKMKRTRREPDSTVGEDKLSFGSQAKLGRI